MSKTTRPMRLHLSGEGSTVRTRSIVRPSPPGLPNKQASCRPFGAELPHDGSKWAGPGLAVGHRSGAAWQRNQRFGADHGRRQHTLWRCHDHGRRSSTLARPLDAIDDRLLGIQDARRSPRARPVLSSVRHARHDGRRACRGTRDRGATGGHAAHRMRSARTAREERPPLCQQPGCRRVPGARQALLLRRLRTDARPAALSGLGPAG